MSARAAKLVEAVHRLAVRYHWTEHESLRLSLPRRNTYLVLIAADDDAQLLAGLLPGD